MGRKPRWRSLWRTPTTLEAIGELTAQWLEGKIDYHPLAGGSPDDETRPLQNSLASVNRQGLVTTFSQPGQALDNQGSSQRAAVEGFAKETIAKRIATLTLYTELLTFIFPPDVTWGYQIPITLEDYHPFTWLGAWDAELVLDGFEEVCSDEAIMELRRAWGVVVIDLNWGREDYLWRHLAHALVSSPDPQAPFDVSPASGLGLEADFIF
jgi:hypothetical protein